MRTCSKCGVAGHYARTCGRRNKTAVDKVKKLAESNGKAFKDLLRAEYVRVVGAISKLESQRVDLANALDHYVEKKS